MMRLQKYLEIAHKQVTTREWDEVLCLCGYNGKGKTHLGFHLVEAWLTLNQQPITPGTVHETVGLDTHGFAKVLDAAKKYGVVMDDEAGDINSRQAMTKVNKLYMEAYQVIRAENLFTIIIIPDYFMLDPYFRKHRVRHLIQVTKRGRCRFWSQKRLHRLNDYNSGREYKNYEIVPPLFQDTFPIYKGVMFEEYQKIKASKMAGVRKKLLSEIEGSLDGGKGGYAVFDRKNRDRAIRLMFERGATPEEIAADLEIKPTTVNMSLKRYKLNKILDRENEGVSGDGL